MSWALRKLSELGTVAVIRLDEIGDLVLTGPFLRELRRNLPRAHIRLAINPAFRNLVECCPYVDRVIDVPMQARGGGWGELAHFGTLIDHAAREWWPDRCDLAILPRYGPDINDARLLAWLIRAPWRVGFDERIFPTIVRKRLALSDPRLLNQRLPSGAALHEVIRNLGVLESIGGTVARDDLELWTAADDEMFAENILGGSGNRDFIAICPSAGHPRRTWPVARYAGIIERLLALTKAGRIVVIGGPGDVSLGCQLSAPFVGRVLDLSGRLTLRQTAAVLRRCNLYIGGDTGPMHLAAAAGASVVEISCHPLGGDAMHANSPLRFGPWKVPAIILQPRAAAPCVNYCNADEPHCILGVSVDEVIEAAQHLLEDRNASA